MSDTPRPVVDMLYRARGDGLHLRADNDEAADTEASTLFGHFSRFDSWYEIDSWIEGHFLERTVKGAFKKTIKENLRSVVVSYDHGHDMQLGDKPLGPIETLREDDEGPYYEVPLLDTDYNRGFILPALQGRTIDGRSLGSVLGASFRFRVVSEQWLMTPKASATNPEGLPERTLTEVRLFEFGPTPMPASIDADAGVRSLTDHFFARAMDRAGRSERAIAALGGHLPPAPAAAGTGVDTPNEPQQHSEDTPNNLRHVEMWKSDIAKLRRRTP